jgi:hypothetical protein
MEVMMAGMDRSVGSPCRHGGKIARSPDTLKAKNVAGLKASDFEQRSRVTGPYFG